LLSEAFEELKKVELLDERDQAASGRGKVPASKPTWIRSA